MVNVTIKSTLNWNTIDWKSANRVVQNLRQRIFRATAEGKIKNVRSLQRLLLRSYSNRVLSVRRVTQVNQGKNTPGVDKLVVKTPASRAKLVEELATFSPEKIQPVRRIYIPKKEKGQLRPLGIPTILDRGVQAMVKNVLEPYWEAKFEATSYGFRPGRGCHDAIAKIFTIARGGKKKKWVVDFDIRGAFDHVCWQHLLETIGNFPARELIKQWLKTGYMEVGELHQTTNGTPQGGVVSPLLLNIALHGMEEALAIKYDGKGSLRSARALVRYADDAVVFCETQEDAREVMMILEKWLAERGLEFSPQKTQLVHITEGFNFLGFNIRQYRSLNTPSGWKLLIKPSQESVYKIRERLRNEWKAFNGWNVAVIIKRLNPIIRGQANYYRPFVASQIFSTLDYYQYHKQVHWARRTHPKKPKRWRDEKYWGCFNPNRKDQWVFGDQKTRSYLLRYSWFPIERHILVKGRASPDDPMLKDSWKKRLLQGCKNLEPKKKRLAQRQEGICPICHQSLVNGEEVQIDHIIPKSRGGLAMDVNNLQLLHLLCHQQKTYQDRHRKVAA
jgi:RNA-directed DNA polymerase